MDRANGIAGASKENKLALNNNYIAFGGLLFIVKNDVHSIIAIFSTTSTF